MAATALAFLCVGLGLTPSVGGRRAASAAPLAQNAPAPASAPAMTARSTAPETPKGGGWVAALFHVHKPVEEPMPSINAPDATLSDAQAASRVQSFSCTGPLSGSRSLICTHWDLATADYNLSLLYRTALAQNPNRRALRRARLLWLKQLDQIGPDAPRILQHMDAFERALSTS